MATASDRNGDVIVDNPQPCASCGEPAHIVKKDGRRICARCFRDQHRASPPAPAG
jgi:ribosomal protein S14